MISIGNPIPSRSPESGFTLMEVMFAGFVLSVGVLGLLSLVTVGQGLARESWETTIAKTAVVNKIEEIKEFAETDFYAVQTSFDGMAGRFDVDNLNPLEGDADPRNGRIHVREAVADDPNLLDVEVRVRWTGVGGNRDVSYRTRLSPFR